jgi:hypothetical protein
MMNVDRLVQKNIIQTFKNKINIIRPATSMPIGSYSQMMASCFAKIYRRKCKNEEFWMLQRQHLLLNR